MKNLNSFKTLINENITDKRYSSKSRKNTFSTSMWGWNVLEIEINEDGNNSANMIGYIKKFEKDLEHILTIKDKENNNQEIEIRILYNSKSTKYPSPYEDENNEGSDMYDDIGEYFTKICSKFDYKRNFKISKTWAKPYNNNEILYYSFKK